MVMLQHVLYSNRANLNPTHVFESPAIPFYEIQTANKFFVYGEYFLKHNLYLLRLLRVCKQSTTSFRIMSEIRR